MATSRELEIARNTVRKYAYAEKPPTCQFSAPKNAPS